MENKDFRRFIPKYLDATPHLLWWEMDEAILIICFLVFGIFLEKILLMLFLGIITSYIYAKIKYNAQDGYFYHLFYSLGLYTFQSNKVKKNKIPKYDKDLFIK